MIVPPNSFLTIASTRTLEKVLNIIGPSSGTSINIDNFIDYLLYYIRPIAEKRSVNTLHDLKGKGPHLCFTSVTLVSSSSAVLELNGSRTGGDLDSYLILFYSIQMEHTYSLTRDIRYKLSDILSDYREYRLNSILGW